MDDVRPPFSDLASSELPRQFAEYDQLERRMAATAGLDQDDIAQARELFDELGIREGWQRLRDTFAVTIEPDVIGGVPVDVVLPDDGLSPKNEDRVLINLHGGGLIFGAGLAAQQESIPIAALGRIKVVTVDYRMGPEHVFPAASQDVAAVYATLLERYDASAIGIYGCSSGSYLTAMALAWFQTHGLPRPGAVGFFGEGAVSAHARWGDSIYTTAALAGRLKIPESGVLQGPPAGAYFRGIDPHDPLVSPGDYPEVLAGFPPSLLVSGSRDLALSSVLHLHRHLIAAGVDARLHVWEGVAHCAYAQGPILPDIPETRETWDVIVRFFDDVLTVSR